MAKREFLQLSHVFDPTKVGIAGWFMSEKLDGQRAFWDSGTTRGMLAKDVPFANVEKDGRLVTQSISTGLWSRYGKVIHAPDWWLDKLPPYLLDGELYIRRNSFQELCSTVKTHVPGPGWRNVRFKVFDAPSPSMIFGDGEIKNTNFNKKFKGVLDWFNTIKRGVHIHGEFESLLKHTQINNDVCEWHHQEQLPFNTTEAMMIVNRKLEEVTDVGGEGLILRKPVSIWTPERTYDSLKVKKLHDAEGIVIGYTWGEQTDKGSKLLGLMGSLRCKLASGVTFKVSGFTDAEREMSHIDLSKAERFDIAREEGESKPGQNVGDAFFNPKFPIGDKITFRYRELTNDGVPKEARYWRKA